MTNFHTQIRIAQIAEAIDAAHERGRLQGLDEAAEEIVSSHKDKEPNYKIWGEEERPYICEESAFRRIEALKTKGGE